MDQPRQILTEELELVKGKTYTPCKVYLTLETLTWTLHRKQRVINTRHLIGAESNPRNEHEFTVHFYKPAKRKFRKHRFQCPSYGSCSRWVIRLDRIAYPDTEKRCFAVLLNPVSGKKKARQLYYKKLLPKLLLSPTSQALFGER
jgi:hypothetical protein